MKIIIYPFLVKKLTLLCKKARFFHNNFLKTAFYGLDLEAEPELNLSKLETGTVKNSYGSATLVADPDPVFLTLG